MRSTTALLGGMVIGAAILVGCAPTPVTKYDVAKNLQKQNKFADAIKEYQQFIEANKDSSLVPYALYNIAWCYRGMYKKDEALAAYKQLIDQYPQSEPAQWAKVDMERLEKMELKPPAPEKKAAPAEE